MSAQRLSPPVVPELPERRLSLVRANLVAAITPVAAAPVRRLRRVLLISALVSTLATGTAVALSTTDFLGEQARVEQRAWAPPELVRVGERIEITRGVDWSFMAWTARDATCVAYAAGSATHWVSVCGRAADNTNVGPRGSQYLLAYSAMPRTEGVSDRRGAVFGATSADVARVDVELVDGRVVPTATNVGAGLDTSARFFIVRETLEQRPFPATSLTFISTAGDVLERFKLGS